jgi:hypothetical protein
MFIKSLLKKILHEDFDELYLLLKQKDHTIEKLTQEKRELEHGVSSLEKKLSSRENRLNQQERELCDLKSTLSWMKSQIDVLQSELSKSAKDLKIEKAKVANLTNDLKVQNATLCAQINTLKTSLTDAESQQKELEGDMNSIIQERDKYRQVAERYSALSSSLQEHESLEAQLKQQLQDKERQYAANLAEQQSLENEIAELNQRTSGLQNELTEKVARIAEMEKTIREQENKMQQLRQSTISEEVVSALRNEIAGKTQIIKTLELDIQKLNEKLSDYTHENEELKFNLEKEKGRCSTLEETLANYAKQMDSVNELQLQLTEARRKIKELEYRISVLPTREDLEKEKKRNAKLQKEIDELCSEKQREENSEDDAPKETEGQIRTSTDVVPKGDNDVKVPTQVHKRYRKINPYHSSPKAPSANVVTKDFPKIENDNVYASSTRLIDKVFDCHANTIKSAESILLHWSAEQISRLSVDLVEARRKDEPYLVCPCCRQMLILASRKVGFGASRRDVQYFTHAVKNLPCELKRDYTPSVSVAGEESEVPMDNSYIREFRTLIYNALTSEVSKQNGVSDVEMLTYISSDELPIMKRRLADVVANYQSERVVFDLITPSTNISKVHDRDLFYLVNNIQVFWVFGLDAQEDYYDLRRSLAKDVLFTNKRNIFVFDVEAQEASRQRGELMLKCNWLDEDGQWYYNHGKNNKNGILISLGQIKFEEDSCRPYYYDADEPYFLAHPYAERPAKLSREDLIKNIEDAWNYELNKKNAVANMLQCGKGVEAYFDGQLWGFKYGDTVFIDPKFKDEPKIVGDFALVNVEDKYGVVNRFGEYSLRVEYAEIHLLTNGHILYCDRGKWYLFGVIDGLCDYAVTDVIEFKTLSQSSGVFHLIIRKSLFVNQPAEEFYFVGTEIFKKNTANGKWSLWLSCGTKVSDVTWDTLEFTSDERIKVSINGCTQWLALDGSVIEEQKYKTTRNLSNGNVLVETFDGLWGMTNGFGESLLEPIYSQIDVLSDMYLKVCKAGVWGVCSIDGEILIESKFRSVIGCDGGVFTVTQPDMDNSWETVTGKVNAMGEPIVDIKTHTENGTDICFSFERYGLQKDGCTLIPCMYNALFYWGKDKYIAKKGDAYGIVSIENKVLLPFEYRKISPLKENRSAVTKGVSSYWIDEKFLVVDDETINLQEGFKKVKIAGKWGIVNPQGDVIVDYKYDEISTFRGRLVGIINGKLIKLNAYYPYRLQMSGLNDVVDNRDIVRVASVSFQVSPKRTSVKLGTSVDVFLMNWTYSMKYPMVQLYNKTVSTKKAKQVDKPDDFAIGEEKLVKVTSWIKKRKTLKGVSVEAIDGSIIHVYRFDLEKAYVDLKFVRMGDKLKLTKLGFNDELDRTIWRVEITTF